MRNIYFGFAEMLGAVVNRHNESLRHEDQAVTPHLCKGRLTFLWRPLIDDLVRAARDAARAGTPLVLSGGFWDALHTRSVTQYQERIGTLRQALSVRPAIAVWITTTTVNDAGLVTPEKRAHMTESTVEAYRVEAQRLHSALAATVDAHAITAPVQGRTTDGVHYPDDVYDVLASALGRTLAAALPVAAPPKVGRLLVGVPLHWRSGLAVLFVLTLVLSLYGGRLSPKSPAGHLVARDMAAQAVKH